MVENIVGLVFVLVVRETLRACILVEHAHARIGHRQTLFARPKLIRRATIRP
jgi:hypothetical protein